MSAPLGARAAITCTTANVISAARNDNGYSWIFTLGNAGAVALAFKRQGAEHIAFILVAVILAAGFVVAVLMRDTRKHSLILED